MPNLQNRPRVEAELSPSRLQFKIIIPIYACVLSGIIVLWPETWYRWMLGLLVTLVLAELWYVWLSQSKNAGRLTLLRSGTLQWRGEWYQYTPLFTCRWCAVLFLRAQGRYQFLPIWRDSCPEDDYHRLHLLLRYISREKN